MSEGVEIGRREGIEIGKAEERKRTDIFKLKLKGNDEAAIAKQLKLSIEQVCSVLDELR